MTDYTKAVSFLDFLPSNFFDVKNIAQTLRETIGKTEEEGSDESEYVEYNFVDDMITRGTNAIESIKAVLTTPSDSKGNEVIDTTYQQGMGDCWILSGVNALSYTEEGARAIKDAIEYKEDGSAVVHFKGGYGDYVVTKEELNSRCHLDENGLLQYSLGDIDMNVIEIATQKAYNDIAEGKILINDENNDSYYDDTEAISQKMAFSNASIDGGMSSQIMNMLTGKNTEHIYEKDEIEESLDNLNGKDFALTCGIKTEAVEGEEDTYYNSREVEDIYGNKVELQGFHSYAIKAADDDTVTITNPWNSGEDIVLPRETFMEYVDRIEKCDMSDANEDEIAARRADDSDEDEDTVIDFPLAA